MLVESLAKSISLAPWPLQEAGLLCFLNAGGLSNSLMRKLRPWPKLEYLNYLWIPLFVPASSVCHYQDNWVGGSSIFFTFLQAHKHSSPKGRGINWLLLSSVPMRLSCESLPRPRPSIGCGNLPHSSGAGHEKERIWNSVEPHDLTRFLSSPFPSKHLGPGMVTVQVGDATVGRGRPNRKLHQPLNSPHSARWSGAATAFRN